MSEPILDVKKLTKTFGTKKKIFTAVDNISFSMQEGEILGFLGPNGAGKTTTIQMLLGALEPTSGDILYFGKKFHSHREEILEQVNFSSTYINLPWDLSIRENLTFMSYFYDITKRNERVDKVIEIFRLEKIAQKKMNQLSAGQITRVNMAKAFINSPKVLLLDEPTASLDPEVALYIREFVLEERQKSQISIIFTSHNMAEVEEICDRVIFINGGKIFADDTPDNLTASIETCHLELHVKDGLKRLIEYCIKEQIPHRVRAGRFIIIDVKEKEIALLLRSIMDQGIMYDEISIEKPTLEDYFLQVAKGKQS